MALVLNQRVTWRTVALITCESALIVGAVVVSAALRTTEPVWVGPALAKGLLVAVICQICLYYGDLYDLPRVKDRRELIARLLQSLGAAALVVGAVYAIEPSLILATGVLTTSVVLVSAVVAGWRLLFDWFSHRMGPRERILIVGTSAAAITLARELLDRKELGVDLVGFVDPDPAKVGMPVINPGVIGTI